MTLKVIADAIAAKYLGATATIGSTTESLVSAPTASLPNTVAATPVILVYHPAGQLEVVMSRIRQDDYDFPVRLLRDPTDYPARSDWLYAWHDALRDRLRDGDTLGPDPRTSGRIVAARLELDGQEYARVKFDVVEYIVRVHVGDLQP